MTASGPPLGSARPGLAAPWWQMVLAQTAMELRLISRRGENLLVTLVIPVGLLLFFGSVAALPDFGSRPVDFLVPGILTLAVISTSMVNLGIATGFERSYGVLKRLGGSPLSRPALLVAKIATVAVVEVAQVALLLVVSIAAFGWSPPPGASFVLTAGGLVLGTIAFAGLGLLMAGALRAEATLAAANALYLVFLLLGGIVFPLDRLPPALEGLARALPASALSELLRAGLGGTHGDVTGPVTLLLVWALGAVAIAGRTFRWE
jgi:ABC-2 type transport system permease protein